MGIINSVKRGPWSQVDGLNPFFFFLPLLFNLLGTKEISVKLWQHQNKLQFWLRKHNPCKSGLIFQKCLSLVQEDKVHACFIYLIILIVHSFFSTHIIPSV